MLILYCKGLRDRSSPITDERVNEAAFESKNIWLGDIQAAAAGWESPKRTDNNIINTRQWMETGQRYPHQGFLFCWEELESS